MSSRKRGFSMKTHCGKWHNGTMGKERRKGFWLFCYLCFARFHFYFHIQPHQFLSKENYQCVLWIFLPFYWLCLSHPYIFSLIDLQIFLICCLLWTHHLPQMLHFMSQTLIWSLYSLLFSTLVSSCSSLTVSVVLAKEKKKSWLLLHALPAPPQSPILLLSTFSFVGYACCSQQLKSFPPFLP